MRTNLKDSLQGMPIAGKGKIIARNTFKFTDINGNEHIRLHNTTIITKTPDGKVILHSGGYKSKTTKERINDFSGYTLYQKKSIWYVHSRYGSADNYPSIPFYDGMILPDSFLKPLQGSTSDIAGDTTKLVKEINTFSDLIVKGVKWPMPSEGDCWACSMKDKAGKIMGESGDNKAHLIEHMKESYMHGSLIVNAMLQAGYQDKQIGFYWNSPNLNDTVKRAVRKYLKKALGIAC